jgi:CRISPR-associated endonuclease Cas1
MTKFRKSMEVRMRTKRTPVWLPYLHEIEHESKDVYIFRYNGGEVRAPLSTISSIMIYGDYGTLDCAIVEQISRKGIPIIIHRRGVAHPIYICNPIRADQSDTLTKQILARQDQRKARHIARKLLLAKFYSMQWLVPAPPLPSIHASIKELRSIEAVHSAGYWREYYRRLGCPASTRRGSGQISAALNAGSTFISGILLRWITYHHLSPFHGYLHTTSDYSSLVYDLIEPYRAHFDKCIFEAAQTIKEPDSNAAMVAIAINAIKDSLNGEIYTGLTRQIVTRHELLHGLVLSLKSYLNGEQRSFMIPTADKPKGGRPKKTNFRLYGRQAGRTDFWAVAKRVSSD